MRWDRGSACYGQLISLSLKAGEGRNKRSGQPQPAASPTDGFVSALPAEIPPAIPKQTPGWEGIRCIKPERTSRRAAWSFPFQQGRCRLPPQ